MSDVPTGSAMTGTATTAAPDETAQARPLIQLLNQDADTDAGGCCGGGSCGI